MRRGTGLGPPASGSRDDTNRAFMSARSDVSGTRDGDGPKSEAPMV